MSKNRYNFNYSVSFETGKPIRFNGGSDNFVVRLRPKKKKRNFFSARNRFFRKKVSRKGRGKPLVRNGCVGTLRAQQI
eukprot:UN11861